LIPGIDLDPKKDLLDQNRVLLVLGNLAASR
jgi:hypothetical protein